VSATSFTATNGTVASVTAVDSSHYTILVNPTAGVASGNVALSLVAGGATDAAGNAAVATSLASLDSQGIDTLAPAAPVLALGIGVANGATAAEATAAGGVVTVTGELNDAISVTFTNGIHGVTKTVTGTGSAQAVTLSATDLTTLTDGTISVSATQTDAAGNAQTAPATTTSFVLDTLAPAVTAVTDNVAVSVTNGPISFTATFSEAVTGVSATSFTATNGTVASVTAVDSSHYTILVNPTAGVASGNVALSLVAGGATDTAGNAVVAANLSGLDSQGIDTLAPAVTAVTDNIVAPVTNGPISFTATFSEAVTGVSATSFTATNGTVASVTAIDSSHYTVVVNPTAGVASGNVALSLVAGGATDLTGNAAVAA